MVLRGKKGALLDHLSVFFGGHRFDLSLFLGLLWHELCSHLSPEGLWEIEGSEATPRSQPDTQARSNVHHSLPKRTLGERG